MPSQLKRPASVSTGGASGNSWTNPNNAIDNNLSSAATATISPALYGSETQKLFLTNCSFSIPADATITGVRVQASFAKNESSTAILYAYLVNGTTRISQSRSVSVSSNPQATYSLGGSSDLWGTSLSPSQVNSSSFGVEFFVYSLNGQSVSLYDLQVEVFYTQPPYMLPAQSDGTTLAAGEAASLQVQLTPGDLASLVGAEGMALTLAGGETSFLQGQELLDWLDRTLDDSALLLALEGGGIQASLVRGETSTLLVLEALGLLYPVQESEHLFSLEGSLLQARLVDPESPLVSGAETESIQASLFVPDTAPLTALELPSPIAQLTGGELAPFSGTEELLLQLATSDLLPLLLAGEGGGIGLMAADLLPLLGSEDIGTLTRIITPRASVDLAFPFVVLSLFDEERELVERIYRGTIAAAVIRFFSVTGQYYDPLSIRLLIRTPSGAVLTFPVTRIGPGTYRAELTFDQAGVWVLRAEGEEPLRAVVEKRVEVVGDL